MRVIVGHPQRPTPSMTGELQQVVFNPSLDACRRASPWKTCCRGRSRTPRSSAHRGFRVLQITRQRRAGGRSGDASHWADLDAGRFPYQLRQKPGPDNSLGRIKIGWNNPFDIYLHDTPARGLFTLGRRTLSSGCVRLENAAALATCLLAQDRDWDEAATLARLEAARTEVINLRHRVPLYIVYLTTLGDAEGAVHFRPRSLRARCPDADRAAHGDSRRSHGDAALTGSACELKRLVRFLGLLLPSRIPLPACTACRDKHLPNESLADRLRRAMQRSCAGRESLTSMSSTPPARPRVTAGVWRDCSYANPLNRCTPSTQPVN